MRFLRYIVALFRKPRKRCDVLLFFATSSEKDALEAAAKELKFPFNEISSKFFDCYYDLGYIGTNKVMAVQTKMGPHSYDGSASRAIHARIETGATALVCLGMAFGVDRDRRQLGDVLVSETLLPYDNREVVCGTDGKLQVNYSKKIRHPARLASLEMLAQESRRDEWRGKISFGALLSGGSKIRCSAYRDELVRELSRFKPPVIGGEMEGCGLLATSDRQDPSWVVVKGISDFADDKRDQEIEQGRPLACENAARFVLQALRDYFPEPITQ